jgi:hypothetical protein
LFGSINDSLNTSNANLIRRWYFYFPTLDILTLRAKKMEGQRDPEGRDIWEVRVTQAYRFTFAIDGDMYILYRIGPHDIERRPR